MKYERNILIAFILNLAFSIFEFIGGIFTKSISITSDAIHDFGDAISIGLSFVLEKKSKRKPNNTYTYGYLRYSIIGAIITNTILIIGGLFVIINAIKRIINPVEINYDGMIIFAIVGFIINLIGTLITREGNSLNQKAVNLHMLEDVLGWLVVLVGAFIIKFTKIYSIDAVMSLLVSIFILYNAFKSYKEILDLFLEKTPNKIDIEEIKEHLLAIKGVINVHHIHIWSIDGVKNLATMHVVTDTKNLKKLKDIIKEELKEHEISHVTIEFEENNDRCKEVDCIIDNSKTKHLHHHHH